MNSPASLTANFSALSAINAGPPAASQTEHALNFGEAIWRADALAANTQASGVIPTGHALLDAELPGGGWPVGALCEILQTHSAQSEWRLLLPALVAAQHGAHRQEAAGRRSLPSDIATVALIGPPHVPFGPALAAQGLVVQRLVWVKVQTPPERLWAAEQALRCEAVAAVLAWLPQVQSASLRRLHMAAQNHAKLLFVMRPAQAQRESSPAPLRLLLGADSPSCAGWLVSEGLHPPLNLDLLKRRGPPMAQPLVVQTSPHAFHGALDRFAA